MVIETRHFGFVEIAPRDVIRFDRGLYGFEGVHRFALLHDRREDSPFFWLQNADAREPCFAVMDPVALLGAYAPGLPPDVLTALDIDTDDALRMLAIATVPHDYRLASLNLRCPIVLNARENRAQQVILEDDAYPMRYPLFGDEQAV